jgi:hypothetical protein
MWDVPGPLDMLLSLEAERRDLFKTCLFPLQILERVAEKMRSMWFQDVTTTPSFPMGMVSLVLSTQNECDALLGVTARDGLTSEMVAGTSEPAVCDVSGRATEIEASQALKEAYSRRKM